MEKLLTKLSLPQNKVAVFGDVHIGVHDEAAIKCLVELFEQEGVDTIIANGDIHDCAAVSPHLGKSRRAAMETGQLAEEAASGRWLIDWMTTRDCIYGPGNHEDWINDVALATNTVGTLTVARALGLPTSPTFRILPHGYQIRIGSLVVEHGDVTLGRSTGGQHLAANILRRYPNQTTLVNHFHHMDYSVNTTDDSDGIRRSHAAYCLGHLSDPSAHKEYAGRSPNWQQGGALIQTYQIDGKTRYNIHMLEVHRDRRGRPFCQFGNRIYR